jgi:proline dehydrogenase
VLRDILIALSKSDVMRRVSMSAPGSRTVSRRFVAGEKLEEGIAAVRRLADTGFFVTMDYLGESVTSRPEARGAADMYLRMLDQLHEQQLANGEPLQTRANVSLKLTQMGQDIPAPPDAPPSSGPAWPKPERGMTPEEGHYDDAFLRENVGRILDRAKQHGIFVRFDMESRFHTQRTLDFIRRLWEEGYHEIGIVLQSYMLRAEHDARVANSLGMRVRLCKGAYKEPPEVAFQDKADVDRNFVKVATLLAAEGNYPGIATHDSAMVRATLNYARDHGIDRSRFEFQMLYGVRRDLQLQLLKEGYNVRVYVPFGEAWYPYLMRRMAERPGNVMFIVNAVIAESPLGGILGRNGR